MMQKYLEMRLRTKDLTIPEGKYYLADAGYSNTDFMMIPYPGIRYHLKEKAQAAMRPADKKRAIQPTTCSAPQCYRTHLWYFQETVSDIW